MSAFSNYIEEQIIKYWLQGGAGAAAAPSTVYVGLFTADPGETGDQSLEADYVNYSRQESVWTNYSSSTGQTKNNTVITFPANGNTEPGDIIITHAAIFDQDRTVPWTTDNGNMLLYGPLASAKTLAPGDVLSFAANALTLTID